MDLSAWKDSYVRNGPAKQLAAAGMSGKQRSGIYPTISDPVQESIYPVPDMQLVILLNCGNHQILCIPCHLQIQLSDKRDFKTGKAVLYFSSFFLLYSMPENHEKMSLQKIDTHTHCVPPFWIEAVKKAGKGPIIVRGYQFSDVQSSG